MSLSAYFVFDGGTGLDNDLEQLCLESCSDETIAGRLPSNERSSCPCGHDDASSSYVFHFVAQVDDSLAVTDQLSSASLSHFANSKDVHLIFFHFFKKQLHQSSTLVQSPHILSPNFCWLLCIGDWSMYPVLDVLMALIWHYHSKVVASSAISLNMLVLGVSVALRLFMGSGQVAGLIPNCTFAARFQTSLCRRASLKRFYVICWPFSEVYIQR